MTSSKVEHGTEGEECLNGPYPQFLLFGDSITQGSCKQELGFNFMPALQDDFVRRLDVINRGFNGYNTAQAKLILPKFMPTPEQAKVDFMTIFFGANDACLPGSPSGQHVPPAEYSANLENIVNHPTVQAHRPRIIIITPPPVDEHQLYHLDPSRTAETTHEYAVRARQVGESLDLAVCDLWSAMMAKAGWVEGKPLVGSRKQPKSAELAAMLSDGLHFLPPGYRVLYESLTKLIKTTWPEEMDEEAKLRLPLWREAPR